MLTFFAILNSNGIVDGKPHTREYYMTVWSAITRIIFGLRPEV